MRPLCLFLCLPAVLCAQKSADALVVGNNTFGVELYREVAKAGGDLVISPYAISESLSMAFLGAMDETKTSMQHTLHYPDRSPQRLARSFANLTQEVAPFRSIAGIWFAQGQPMLHSYQTMVDEAFPDGLHEAVFVQPSMMAVEINQWMSDRSGAVLRQLTEPIALGRKPKIALASGALVQVPWLFPFDPDQTAGSVMHQLRRLPYLESNELEMVAIPYERTSTGHLVLALMMPKGKLADFESQLSYQRIEDAFAQMEIKAVQLKIPSFQTTTRIYARQFLEQLGMHLPFLPGANFSAIDGERDLSLTTVVHEAQFSISEGGAGMANPSQTPPSYQGAAEVMFTADRPFFYILLDIQTGQYLLFGRLESL